MVTKRTPKELHKKSKELYWNIRNIGKNGQSSKWAYYYCKCILNGKKDVPRTFDQADATKVDGKAIDVKLTKKQYLKKMEEYCAYIERHKKLPNHVTILEKYRVKPKIWTAYVGYLFKVYYETGKLPSSQSIKSDIYTNKSEGKKYGRSTEYGCDNRGQNNNYYCGPHMIQEIIRNLTGKVISQSTLAGVIGTTTDGSDHDGLNTAIAWFNKKYNYNLSVEWKNFSDLGWSGIKKILESKNQDCGIHELYRDTWGHYTNYDKVYDDTVDVHNSLGDGCSGSCFCGYTENRDKSDARRYVGGISQKSVMVVTRK